MLVSILPIASDNKLDLTGILKKKKSIKLDKNSVA